MKRVLLILFLLIISFNIFAVSYQVETSRGIQEVIIPEGMTEKDVLLLLAKSYYEQAWDYEEVLNQSKELSLEVSQYIEENQILRNKYEGLIQDYDLILKRYKMQTFASAVKGLAGASIAFNETNSMDSISLKLGALLFNKVIAFSEISYPLSWSLGVDILF